MEEKQKINANYYIKTISVAGTIVLLFFFFLAFLIHFDF